MREDPPPDTRCRDKFLVQSVAVSPDKEFNNWQSVDRNGRSTIQEQKIRVVFLPPSGDGGSLSTQRLTNGMYGVDDSTSVGPPAYSPPSPHHLATPESSSHNSSNARNLRQSTPYSDTETSVAYETAPSNTVSSAVAGVSNEIPSMPELKEAVVGAKETAMSSIAQHDDQGLRQRKAGGESSSQKEKTPSLLATLAPTQASEGVPVQIVAILCLLSFLIAYLFF
ncbi:MAG: phosphatidylinositol-binding protein scs2 [Trizodia sp. TS-e1964]|nr:MAG: phosphatidylinositol-binding protein scs2 [Trizodia sp. TS-e1964]